MNFPKEYELIEERELKDLNSTGYYLRHLKTGARVCILSNDDENKVFTIGFRTPPVDDCGTPHIIEHSVLCGSKKYPPKDPFVELVKGSLNTFLNAMTFGDKTIYPVASCNDKDFHNLMDVYLDAVFFPNTMIRREFFEQEGWHYELESKDDELKVNGVVYNEMKGVYSNPDSILADNVNKVLFSDNCYSKDSGGDPKIIPKLTYENYKKFYEEHYHPSNSFIFMYGDMDMKEKLEYIDSEYLSRFEKCDIDTTIPHQKPFDKKKEIVIDYPISNEEDENEKNWYSYDVVVGNAPDVKLSLAFEILDYALVSAPGAPVRQALNDAHIGKDVDSDFDNSQLQSTYSIVVQDAKAGKRDEFVRIVEDVLKSQVKNGINRKALLAAINSNEFKYREADFGNYPKGLIWCMSGFTSWLYDEDKPFSFFEAGRYYDELRADLETGYFEKLIEELILDNPHKVIATMNPRKGLVSENEEELRKKLKDIKDKLSADEIQKIVENTAYLKEFQNTPSPEEELLKIPQLVREDLKKEANPLNNVERKAGNVKVLAHPMFTSGITYMKLLFDVRGIDRSLIRYLGLYRAVFASMDTKKYTYNELSNEINLNMGGFSNALQVYDNYRYDDSYSFMFEVTFKAFDNKVEDSLGIIKEIMQNTDFSSRSRLHEIISQNYVSMQSIFMTAGNQAGILRARSYYSEKMFLKDAVSNIGYYGYIRDMLESFDERYEEIVSGLRRINEFILRKGNFFVSVTCSKDQLEKLDESIAAIDDMLEYREVDLDITPFEIKKKNEGFKCASQVQYVCTAGDFKSDGFEYSGTMRVAKNILSYEYLWTQIRVLGGAYGCGGAANQNGEAFFMTYRDPNLKRSIDVFNGVPEFLGSFDADDREMDKYVIGTIGDMDIPLNAKDKGERSLNAYITGTSYEQIQRYRDEVLNAKPEDIRKLADPFRAALDKDNICVIGSESAIDENKELFMNIESL